MKEINPFHIFADNTKLVSLIIGISLLLIIFTSITSFNTGSINNTIGKLIAISLLSYAFIKNCKETTKLVNDIPDLFSNSQLSNIRNNTILSYILSISILILIIYIFYTIFF